MVQLRCISLEMILKVVVLWSIISLRLLYRLFIFPVAVRIRIWQAATTDRAHNYGLGIHLSS